MAAAISNIVYPLAEPIMMPDNTKHDSPNHSTGRAPMRSTTNPEDACPMPDTTKKVDTSRPSRAKSRSNAAPSDTYNDGSTNWKKCDEPWATPISRMVNQSRRRMSGASRKLLSEPEDMARGGQGPGKTNAAPARRRAGYWDFSRMAGQARCR